MNKELLKKVWPQGAARLAWGECPICGKPVKITDLKDTLSKSEYMISGLCQECQDKTFTQYSNE